MKFCSRFQTAGESRPPDGDSLRCTRRSNNDSHVDVTGISKVAVFVFFSDPVLDYLRRQSLMPWRPELLVLRSDRPLNQQGRPFLR